MTPDRWIRLVWILNGCLIGLVVWSLHDARGVSGRVLKKIDRKRADLERLREVEVERSGAAACIRAFEKLPVRRPVQLGELLHKVAPGVASDIRPNALEPSGFGWSLRRVEMDIEEMKLSDLGRFLQVAESQRPPWRLEECSIVAADNQPGTGRVSLVFEALEKSM